MPKLIATLVCERVPQRTMTLATATEREKKRLIGGNLLFYPRNAVEAQSWEISLL